MEDGILTPAAVTIEELKRTGVSVHRAEHAVAGHVAAAVQNRLAARERRNPARRCEAKISAPSAGRIRAVRAEETDGQAFAVIDTAESGNPGHASIYCRNPEMPHSRLRKLRTDRLLPVLQENLMTVDEALKKIAK